MKIKAAVVSEISGPFLIEQLELSDPNDDEVLVRIVSAGVCGTDLGAQAGHLPIPPPPSVFGHEGAGVVEKVGARVTKVRPGLPALLVQKVTRAILDLLVHLVKTVLMVKMASMVRTEKMV